MMVGDKLPGMVPSYGATCTGFASDGEGYTATVVYIHPQRRFYSVEFVFARGRRFRESFYFPDRAGMAGPGYTNRRPAPFPSARSRLPQADGAPLARTTRQPRLPGRKKKSKRCKK